MKFLFKNSKASKTVLLWISICLVISVSTSKKHSPRLLSANKTAAEVKVANEGSGELSCNQEMMTSYGLEGLREPSNKANEMCPSISSNCCTPEDVTLTTHLWRTDAQKKIEAYYETYLYSLKYILGFAYEVDMIADEQLQSDRSACRNTATEFKTLNINREVAKEIFRAFVESLEKMAEIRRGFYCVLCDAVTQSRLKDYWSITNVFYSDRIYFNQEFCKDLVEHTIRGAYFEIFYLKRFAELSTKLMGCQMGQKNLPDLEYDIPYWNTQQVKNCYYFKNKYFFFFCENYCERFHITKANPTFDGNLEELKKFVTFFKENRNDAFYSPSDNFLLDGLGWEEEFLMENFREFEKNNNNKIFFKPVTQQVQLDTFETDILLEGGFNPIDSAKGSLYPIELAGANKFICIFMAATMALLLNK